MGACAWEPVLTRTKMNNETTETGSTDRRILAPGQSIDQRARSGREFRQFSGTV